MCLYGDGVSPKSLRGCVFSFMLILKNVCIVKFLTPYSMRWRSRMSKAYRSVSMFSCVKPGPSWRTRIFRPTDFRNAWDLESVGLLRCTKRHRKIFLFTDRAFNLESALENKMCLNSDNWWFLGAFSRSQADFWACLIFCAQVLPQLINKRVYILDKQNRKRFYLKGVRNG